MSKKTVEELDEICREEIEKINAVRRKLSAEERRKMEQICTLQGIESKLARLRNKGVRSSYDRTYLEQKREQITQELVRNNLRYVPNQQYIGILSQEYNPFERIVLKIYGKIGGLVRKKPSLQLKVILPEDEDI